MPLNNQPYKLLSLVVSVWLFWNDVLIKKFLFFRWSLIAGRLPGRTDNEVKNYWNSHLRRKLLKMGIDPNDHRPNHGIPRPTTEITNNVSADATSLSLNVHTSPPAKHHGDYDRKERDDERICPEEVPDLNLELTISFQSPSQAKAEEGPNCTECNLAGGSQSAPSPTLLLFK